MNFGLLKIGCTFPSLFVKAARPHYKSHLNSNLLKEIGGRRQVFGNSTKQYSTTLIKDPQPNEEVLDHKKVRVLDADINYVETEGKGSHVVLCLPGAFSSIELDFLPLINQFDKDKFKVVVWDPPGYGRSRPPKFRYFSPEILTKDATYLAEFMNILGHKKYSVLGWSSGAGSGNQLTVQNPSNVQKLVIWGCTGYLDQYTTEVLKKLSLAGVASLPKQRLKDLISLYGEEDLNKMWKNWTASGPPFLDAGHAENGEYATKVLNKIKCPTLIIHGQKDGFVAEEQAHYLNKNIANSRLHLMSKGHHNLHVTCVQEFTKIVEDFLLIDNV